MEKVQALYISEKGRNQLKFMVIEIKSERVN